MWMFAKNGFVSIKQHKDDPNKLFVRAAVKGDLEAMFPGCVVTEDDKTDYRFSATIDRQFAASTIANAVREIHRTGGFKTSLDDVRRYPFYCRIWDVVRDMQEALSEVAASTNKPTQRRNRPSTTGTSQNEKDITQKLYDRLHTIATDHVHLCEIAEISDSSHSILFSVLGRFLIQGLAETTQLSADEFGATMADALQRVRNQEARSRNA
jgi:hypothetical protein